MVVDDNFGRWLWKMSVNDDGDWRAGHFDDRKSRKLENGSPRLEGKEEGFIYFLGTWEC